MVTECHSTENYDLSGAPWGEEGRREMNGLLKAKDKLCSCMYSSWFLQHKPTKPPEWGDLLPPTPSSISHSQCSTLAVMKQLLGWQKSQRCQWNKLSHFMTWLTQKRKKGLTKLHSPETGGGGRGETSSLGAWTLSSLTTPPRLDTLFFSRWKSPHAQLWKVSGRQGCWFQLIKPPVYCRDLWVALWVCTLGTNSKIAVWWPYPLSPKASQQLTLCDTTRIKRILKLLSSITEFLAY